MFPFNPFIGQTPFLFNPFISGNRRRRIKTLMGIPVLRTTGVSASTTSVSYTVNECDFASLPTEGIFFLDVRQSAPTGSEALPVAFTGRDEPAGSSSLLLDALQEDVPASDLVANGRYLIYYNKRTSSYQLVNAYPATA